MGCFPSRRESIIPFQSLQAIAWIPEPGQVPLSVKSSALSFLGNWRIPNSMKLHLSSLHSVWMAKVRWHISRWSHQYLASTCFLQIAVHECLYPCFGGIKLLYKPLVFLQNLLDLCLQNEDSSVSTYLKLFLYVSQDTKKEHCVFRKLTA